MKEPIASLVYAAPRCTDLAELKAIKDMFVRKYGKEFANSVEELRPDCGVNRVVSMLSHSEGTWQLKCSVCI